MTLDENDVRVKYRKRTFREMEALRKTAKHLIELAQHTGDQELIRHTKNLERLQCRICNTQAMRMLLNEFEVEACAEVGPLTKVGKPKSKPAAKQMGRPRQTQQRRRL